MLQAEPSFFRARLRLTTCHSRLGDLPSALSALGPDATSAANMAEAAGKRADLEALQERLSKVRAAFFLGVSNPSSRGFDITRLANPKITVLLGLTLGLPWKMSAS